jgi:RNA polymerase sigma-70 factor (ECF subfamily)
VGDRIRQRLSTRARRRATTRVGKCRSIESRVTASPDGEIGERDAFGRAFGSIPVEARAILVLHHMEERSVAEIAHALGIPNGTVKSRLFSARRELERALERERA